MGLEETDWYAALLRADGRLAQVDISDVDRTPPDGRKFDFARLLDALGRVDYRGYLVFEYKSAGDGMAEADAGLRYIRSLD